jgi:hypothetical protein
LELPVFPPRLAKEASLLPVLFQLVAAASILVKAVDLQAVMVEAIDLGPILEVEADPGVEPAGARWADLVAAAVLLVGF